MCLSPPQVADKLSLLGETEASSAGEQLAKGYPGRAVTDFRSGGPAGLPGPLPPAVIVRHASKNSRPKGGTKRPPSQTAAASSMWSEFPEKCGQNFRNAHLRMIWLIL